MKWNDYRDTARQRGALALELFVVHSVPNGDRDAIKSSLPDHLDYQRVLEKQGKLAFAGPVSDESGEEMQGQGMIIYRANNLEEAKQLASNDPMHLSGARQFTMRKWLINEGSLNLSVGLSTGKVCLD